MTQMNNNPDDRSRLAGPAPIPLTPGHDVRDGHDGYTIERHDHGVLDRGDLARIGLVALCAVLVWLRVWEPFPRVSIIGLLATLIGGWPIFREAIESLFERRMTMELSMTIALGAAL